jgi:hypothetical protein
MSYTKGKWKRLSLLIGEYSDTFYAIGLDMTHAIATVNRKSFPAEADDNANLIAAAPKLYKALKRFLESSACTNGCDPNDMTCDTNFARMAIAEAEGKKYGRT